MDTSNFNFKIWIEIIVEKDEILSLLKKKQLKGVIINTVLKKVLDSPVYFHDGGEVPTK